MLAAESKAGDLPDSSAAPGRLTPAWKAIIQPVEPFLEQVATQLTEQVQSFDPEIATYAQYALTSQGKQLRPVLVALSGGATGRINDSLATVAVIIEMVHLATLVHDDIMDEAVLRRKRPTLAANWGNEISVLLGDCLFAHAVSLAASFPTPDVCRAVASATKTVCSGEILQTHHRRNFRLTRAEYFKVLEMKTAELFALSCEMGAWLGGGTSASRASLRKFGTCFGTAYQLYDDCLDLFGSELSAGKSLGTDLASGKLTLPILIVLERASGPDREKLCNWIQQWEPRFLPCIRELLEQYNAQNAARVIVDHYLEMALHSLKPLPDSASRGALTGLIKYLAQLTDGLGVSN